MVITSAITIRITIDILYSYERAIKYFSNNKRSAQNISLKTNFDQITACCCMHKIAFIIRSITRHAIKLKKIRLESFSI